MFCGAAAKPEIRATFAQMVLYDQSGESRRLIPLALGSAMATAGYSLADGLGA
jgi:hypothetical protein